MTDECPGQFFLHGAFRMLFYHLRLRAEHRFHQRIRLLCAALGEHLVQAHVAELAARIVTDGVDALRVARCHAEDAHGVIAEVRDALFRREASTCFASLSEPG